MGQKRPLIWCMLGQMDRCAAPGTLKCAPPVSGNVHTRWIWHQRLLCHQPNKGHTNKTARTEAGTAIKLFGSDWWSFETDGFLRVWPMIFREEVIEANPGSFSRWGIHTLIPWHLQYLCYGHTHTGSGEPSDFPSVAGTEYFQSGSMESLWSMDPVTLDLKIPAWSAGHKESKFAHGTPG